jgi:metallo-beta-lactamase family protein
VRLTIHGAAGEVTGSCMLVETGRSRVLIECGLLQGGQEEVRRNAEPFPFDPASLDAVVISHAHIDHSGRLPLLVKRGGRARIYTHTATRDLCRIMLRDAAFLQEKDAELETRKRARRGKDPVEPLYDRADAARAVRRIRGLDYGVTLRIAAGVELTLHDAGHILGSAIVELVLEEGGQRRRLVFSGDLGHRGMPLMHEPARPGKADLVVMESTYGDRAHRSWDSTFEELGGVFEQAVRHRGNILVPAFAVGRTQELLYLFRQHFDAWGMDQWQIFLDSPMAIAATEVYTSHWYLHENREADGARPLALPNLRFTQTPKQSEALNRISSGAIIIAGSGMCTGGRIRHHLKHNLWRDGCHVLITGFQARGTLGRALVDGATEVKLWGEPVRVGATVHTVGGLSAHAGRPELLEWVGSFHGSPPVVLVHGEPSALRTLAADIGPKATIATPHQVIAL